MGWDSLLLLLKDQHLLDAYTLCMVNILILFVIENVGNLHSLGLNISRVLNIETAPILLYHFFNHNFKSARYNKVKIKISYRRYITFQIIGPSVIMSQARWATQSFEQWIGNFRQNSSKGFFFYIYTFWAVADKEINKMLDLSFKSLVCLKLNLKMQNVKVIYVVLAAS